MDFPWAEAATLVRMPAARNNDEASELLFEGTLLVMAHNLKISLPNRLVRPHTFKDDSLTALIDDIPFTV
jgi:hypothetical protein